MKKKVDSGSIYGSGSQQEYDQLLFMINQAQNGMKHEAKRFLIKTKNTLSPSNCPKTTFAP